MSLFVYLHCDDLSTARSFYTEILGLEEVFHDGAVVGYLIGDAQLTIEQAGGPALPEGWARQLGWAGGSETATSLGFEVDEGAFAGIVGRCKDSGVQARLEDPHWVEYWSYPVRDPMGNTIEISTPGKGAWDRE